MRIPEAVWKKYPNIRKVLLLSVRHSVSYTAENKHGEVENHVMLTASKPLLQ